KGAVGDSPFADAAARIELTAPMRLSAASGKATLKLEQWFPWLRTKAPLDDIASLSGGVELALNRLALRFDRPQDADYDAVLKPDKVSAGLKMLPAPVSVSGGAVHAGPSRVRLEEVPVAMLDARAVFSGTYDVKKTVLEIGLTEGVTGEKLVRWALERGALPQ